MKTLDMVRFSISLAAVLLGWLAVVSPTNAEADLALYRSVSDSVHSANIESFDARAASGEGYQYYHFQYILSGTLSMYEATGDRAYLERVLAWAETMVAEARIVDDNGDRNWSGPWSYAGAEISYQLYDQQGSTELARLARIILTDPDLEERYGTRARVIYEFVKQDIVDKILFVRDQVDWYRDQVVQQEQPMSDKVALMMRILTDLYLIDGERRYGDLLTELARDFQRRFQPYRDALIWDLGIRFPVKYGACDGKGCLMDTSHGNRYPYAVVDLYRAGIVFTKDDVEGLGELLRHVIWNGSYEDPRFTNFIDGSNGDYGPQNRGPWSIGQIYSGWITLGEFDPHMQAIGDAVLRAIVARKRNPSLDYMSHSSGTIALTGHLARNLVTARDRVPVSTPE